jgi:DNA-directed RNA polymerase specialized sigma24 family protein
MRTERPTDESTSRLILGFAAGRAEAIGPLVRRCYARVVRLAAARLRSRQGRSFYDAEDAANSALARICRAAEQGRLGQLEGRDEFWRLVQSVITRRVIAMHQRERSLKRGGPGTVRSPGADDRVTGGYLRAAIPVEAIASPEAATDAIAIARIELARLLDLLGDPLLRQIALLRLEGYTNLEIVAEVARPLSTVERKLRVIREIWGRLG